MPLELNGEHFYIIGQYLRLKATKELNYIMNIRLLRNIKRWARKIMRKRPKEKEQSETGEDLSPSEDDQNSRELET